MSMPICHNNYVRKARKLKALYGNWTASSEFGTYRLGERGGSVVECRTPEREVRGSKPTAAVLCPWARHFTPRKYWLITQEAVAPSRHDWKIVDWDVKPQHNQPTYPICEQRRFRGACASAQSRQNLRCSLIQTVSQEEPSDRKPDPWPLWMAGHAQLKFAMTECSKTQIRMTGGSINSLRFLIFGHMQESTDGPVQQSFISAQSLQTHKVKSVVH